MRRKTLGSIQIITSSICFGALPLLVNIAYKGGANAVSILAIRFSIAAALIWGYLLLNKTKIHVTIKQLVIFAFVAIFGYGLMAYCYFISLHYIPSSMAAMIMFSYPILVTYLSSILLNSPITKAKVIALILVTIGAVFMTWGDISFNPFGIILVLASAFCYAMYIVYLGSSFTFDQEPKVLSAFIILFSAIFFMSVGWINGDLTFALTGSAWWAIIIMAIFATVFAIMVFYAGVRNLEPSLAAIISTIEPITAFLLGIVVLKEQIFFNQWLGSILILIGVVYVQAAKKRPKIDWKARI